MGAARPSHGHNSAVEILVPDVAVAFGFKVFVGGEAIETSNHLIEVFEDLDSVLPMPEWVKGVTVTVEMLFGRLKF